MFPFCKIMNLYCEHITFGNNWLIDEYYIMNQQIRWKFADCSVFCFSFNECSFFSKWNTKVAEAHQIFLFCFFALLIYCLEGRCKNSYSFTKVSFRNVTFLLQGTFVETLNCIQRGGLCPKQRGQAFIPLKISNQDFKSRRCVNWNDLFIRMILETRIFWSPSNNISQQQQIDTNSQYSS